MAMMSQGDGVGPIYCEVSQEALPSQDYAAGLLRHVLFQPIQENGQAQAQLWRLVPITSRSSFLARVGRLLTAAVVMEIRLMPSATRDGQDVLQANQAARGCYRARIGTLLPVRRNTATAS